MVEKDLVWRNKVQKKKSRKIIMKCVKCKEMKRECDTEFNECC